MYQYIELLLLDTIKSELIYVPVHRTTFTRYHKIWIGLVCHKMDTLNLLNTISCLGNIFRSIHTCHLIGWWLLGDILSSKVHRIHTLSAHSLTIKFPYFLSLVGVSIKIKYSETFASKNIIDHHCYIYYQPQLYLSSNFWNYSSDLREIYTADSLQ